MTGLTWQRRQVRFRPIAGIGAHGQYAAQRFSEVRLVNIRKSHLAAVTVGICLGLIPFVATMFLLNETSIDPEVLDKEAYLGCYGVAAGPVLKISDRAVIGLSAKQSTILKRILSVKGDDAINTEKELIFSPETSSLQIGQRDTGFFYILKREDSQKTLVLYDRQGSSYELAKQPC